MRENVSTESPTGIKVLVKTMSILNLLGATESAELPLNEIAARLDLNKSTCHHILDTLAGGGYVEKTAPGRYRLGIKLFQVGSRLLDHLDVRGRAQPVLADAQRLTGETVFLYIQRGDEAVCVERLDGQYAATHLLGVGGALPLHVGGAPKVFLATCSDSEVEGYIERAQVSPSSRYPLDTRQVWRDIEDYRRTGCATGVGDIEINTNAVGAPIRDHTRNVVGAISISWVEALSKNSAAEMCTTVMDAAQRVSAAMGYLPDPAKEKNADK